MASPTTSPECNAIRLCRVDLTKMLSTCYKEVAKYLRQSETLSDEQCREIIQNREKGAEMLMNIMIVSIEVPTSTLDSFAYFVTAMKKSGNKSFQTFVKEKIESKRKELYREFLRVSPGFKASQEYDVFISYSRSRGDGTNVTVDTLLALLGEKGLSVFVDRDGLQTGDRWRPEIASAIKTCKVFVVVLTKRYMRSDFCNAELYEAEALDKCLFPVVCENGWEDVLGGEAVREVVRDIQYVSLVALVAEDKEKKMTELVQRVKEKSGRGDEATVPAPPVPAPPVPAPPESPNLPIYQAANGPEYRAMVRSTPQLVDILSQDPVSVAQSLFAAELIAPGILEEVQVLTTGSKMASRLADVVTGCVKIRASVFREFIQILEEQGDWTKDLIDTLKGNLRA